MLAATASHTAIAASDNGLAVATFTGGCFWSVVSDFDTGLFAGVGEILRLAPECPGSPNKSSLYSSTASGSLRNHGS